MGTKFVLASLLPLTVQLLYLQTFFVISCLFQIVLSSNDTEKVFFTSEKGFGLYEKNLRN